LSDIPLDEIVKHKFAHLQYDKQDDEMHFIMNAIEDIAKNHEELGKDYTYNGASNEFVYREDVYAQKNKARAKSWFKL